MKAQSPGNPLVGLGKQARVEHPSLPKTGIENPLDLCSLGKQARVEHPSLRSAILVWGNREEFECRRLFWLSCYRRALSCVELKFAWGFWNEDKNFRFQIGTTESHMAHSWAEARDHLIELRSTWQLYLPDDLLNHSVCWILTREIAPKLSWGSAP